MMRSGTTVLRLILNKLFNEYRCFKDFDYQYEIIEGKASCHQWEKLNKDSYLITTWRDPRDVVISFMRLYEDNFKHGPFVHNQNEPLISVESRIKFISREWIIPTYWDIAQCENENENKIVLKYENWHEDFDYLFNILEKSLNGKINNEIRDLIKNEYSKESIKSIQSKYKDFFSWEDETHIHGNHVGTGLSTWESVWTPSQIELANTELKHILNHWNNLQ